MLSAGTQLFDEHKVGAHRVTNVCVELLLVRLNLGARVGEEEGADMATDLQHQEVVRPLYELGILRWSEARDEEAFDVQICSLRS
eukprot:scaffold260260_cov31-Tisochrysis_lutea.AAC.2